MLNLCASILQFVGLVLLVASAYLLQRLFGLAITGLVLLLIGIALERRVNSA